MVLLLRISGSEDSGLGCDTLDSFPLFAGVSDPDESFFLHGGAPVVTVVGGGDVWAGRVPARNPGDICGVFSPADIAAAGGVVD